MEKRWKRICKKGDIDLYRRKTTEDRGCVFLLRWPFSTVSKGGCNHNRRKAGSWSTYLQWQSWRRVRSTTSEFGVSWLHSLTRWPPYDRDDAAAAAAAGWWWWWGGRWATGCNAVGQSVTPAVVMIVAARSPTPGARAHLCRQTDSVK